MLPRCSAEMHDETIGWMDGRNGRIDGWMVGGWVGGCALPPPSAAGGVLGDGDRWLAREWAEIARFP